jgi:hypothetical protein
MAVRFYTDDLSQGTIGDIPGYYPDTKILHLGRADSQGSGPELAACVPVPNQLRQPHFLPTPSLAAYRPALAAKT